MRLVLKISKFLLSGLWLSIPAAILIYLGLIYDREPGSWLLFGVALILGFPWNVFGFLPILYSIYKIYIHLSSNIENLHIIHVHPYILLFVWVTASGFLGAHVNGIVFSFFVKKVQSSAKKYK